MTSNNLKKRIAVIAGDGIGQEVMPEGIKVLERIASICSIPLELETFDFQLSAQMFSQTQAPCQKIPFPSALQEIALANIFPASLLMPDRKHPLDAMQVFLQSHKNHCPCKQPYQCDVWAQSCIT